MRARCGLRGRLATTKLRRSNRLASPPILAPLLLLPLLSVTALRSGGGVIAYVPHANVLSHSTSKGMPSWGTFRGARATTTSSSTAKDLGAPNGGQSSPRRLQVVLPFRRQASVGRLVAFSTPGGGNDGDGLEGGDDPNLWSSTGDFGGGEGGGGGEEEEEEDWEDMLKRRKDPDSWGSSFASVDDEGDDAGDDNDEGGARMSLEEGGEDGTIVDDSEEWLNTIASISADEVEFMDVENRRADNVRQMQELGFDAETIGNAMGVATDDALERDGGALDAFRNATAQSGFGMMVDDSDVDLATVESHTMVEKDEESGDPVRSQMVYVDEHSCIGCTNCAMIAPSTFFMEDYLGRARVFEQWGDDDETIKVAIQTCPVDCIHYVPYDELVKLEVERRDQNINFKARLVNQGEYGGGVGHRVGGPNVFTDAPIISGNMGSRCNNCPSAGCFNCPMYGVGKNPEFERKEVERSKRREEKMRKQAMESANKSVDL